MYKLLEHNGVKHPIRVSNSVLGEWQEETGKTDMKTMTFKDIRIMLWHSLKEGYEFADKEFKLQMKDVKLMIDDQDTVEKFLRLIPEFYPTKDQKKEQQLGKTQTPEEK